MSENIRPGGRRGAALAAKVGSPSDLSQTLLGKLKRAAELAEKTERERDASDNALRSVSVALGGSDEWTTQENMIADVIEQAKTVRRQRDEAQQKIKRLLTLAKHDQARISSEQERAAHAEACAEKAERERDEAREALAELKENVSYVVSRFEADEADGYRSRDRQMVIDLFSRPDVYEPPENGDAITRARGAGKRTGQ